MGDKPCIVIIGNSSLVETVQKQLSEFEIHQQTEEQGYMKLLIEKRVAIILLDAHIENWSLWASTPKASPATRRIPIILLSDDTAIRADASVYGVDLAFSHAEFLKNSAKIVQDYARVISPELIEALDCDCQEALPELAQEGVRKFNAGEYYKQHDLFEELWMQTESPVRALYQAVLQVGIAYFQIERGNYRGAIKMLQRSVQWLLILPDTCQGINVKQLREDSFRVRAELERLGEARFPEFDKTLIHKVKLADQKGESQ